jgi:hypothetical protein
VRPPSSRRADRCRIPRQAITSRFFVLCSSFFVPFLLFVSACAVLSPAGKAPDERFGRLEGGPDAERWLGPDVARAREAGALGSEVIAVEAGAPGDRVGGLLEVPTDVCVLLIARAAESVEDVDLFAYGDDGSLLGSDEAPDRKPTLLVCPPHPRRLYVMARIAAGHGLVAVGAQRVPADQAARVGQSLGAKGGPGRAARGVESWPGLDEKLAEHRRRIGGVWQDVRRAAIPLDPALPTRVSAVVEQERCLDVLVLPSAEVAHLDVAMLDERGQILGRASAFGRDRALILCSPVRAIVTLEVRPHAGRGMAAVVISRTETGGARELDARPLLYELAPMGDLAESRDQYSRRLEGLGYERAKLLGDGALSLGRRTSLTLELPSGCARLGVHGERPVRSMEAWLWSADGSLLARERGSGRIEMFACGSGGKVRLDLESLSLPGRFAVESRRERDAPALLAAHPLAASRLMARMHARGVIKNARDVTAPTEIALDAGALFRRELLVPARRCIDATVALGHGASGAEVRWLDARSGNEIDRARGTHAAGARACAFGPGELRATLEISLSVGRTSAILSTRTLAPRE